jgi:hypothetical protein
VGEGQDLNFYDTAMMTSTINSDDNDASRNNCNVKQCYTEAYERIIRMIHQENTTYTTRDYINRRRKRSYCNKEYSSMSSNIVYDDNDDSVDPTFRGKMCQWSYRICDHFGTNREIVSFAFSFLDRFIDQYNCDRSGFKLAAMTSMYIATKMMNVKILQIASLVEMCHGEFQAHQFLQMERIILSALEFRMNPPTTQAFIEQLGVFLPTMNEKLVSDVFSRAIFYAELSTYDYRFVPQSNCHIAIGCVLNAIFDCYDDGEIAEIVQTTFLTVVCNTFGDQINLGKMQEIQERLWFLYKCSIESSYDAIHYDMHHPSSFSLKYPVNERREQNRFSPVSVTKRFGGSPQR